MTDLAPSAPLARVARRERDRQQRQRRAAKLAAMRATVAALEHALPVILTLHENDDDVQWDGFLDADGLRVRRLIRQSLELTKKAYAIETTQRQLQRLLREHQLASYALSGLLDKHPVDSWEKDVARWWRLTRKHFKPWTIEDCEAEVDAARNEMNVMRFAQDAQSSGVSFLGWREQRVVEPSKQSFKYMFHKDFSGHDMVHYVDRVWQYFSNADQYHSIILGGHARSSVKILQQLSSTMRIIRYIERYPAFDVHALALLARVETKDGGFIQFVRSIHAPALHAVINGPNDVWPTNRIWYKWEPLVDDRQSYRFFAGGYITATDTKYVNRWLVEALVALVRGESLITRRPLLKSN